MSNNNKDWTGNSRSSHVTIGARNYALEEREPNDFYATDPKALELILPHLNLAPSVWECAVGGGHLAEVLVSHGYNVFSSDKYPRGYQHAEIFDFLTCDRVYDGDILTNPPYKYAKEFVEKALELVPNGNQVVMFLKLQFLESKSRRELFEVSPPKTIWVSSSRLQCYRNGEKTLAQKSSAVAYAWWVWEKGFKGDPVIKWFN